MAPSNRSGAVSTSTATARAPRRCSRQRQQSGCPHLPGGLPPGRRHGHLHIDGVRRWPHGHEPGVAGGLQSTTLFHFPEPRHWTLRGVGIRGSSWLPRARRPAARADRRIVIARSWNGMMELHNVPFRAVGSGDFCPLYRSRCPTLLKNAQPGARSTGAPRERRGQFSWLTCGRKPERTDTRREPRPSGRQLHLRQPRRQHELAGELGTGRRAPRLDEQLRFALASTPVGRGDRGAGWSATRGQGSKFDYLTAAFVP